MKIYKKDNFNRLKTIEYNIENILRNTTKTTDEEISFISDQDIVYETLLRDFI